ncbi:hypothetical protein LSH36_110g05095 [Paralvinella palmiformis]|uniref:Fork-head domain-containing protein n=1 Tax=Paralvinella palmiformis TaxID=53620 RepID=A0AAD9JZI0_9ANNE|nr:hypothetical protein LSH36_110g05095 [Paralvinella palmiformis]
MYQEQDVKQEHCLTYIMPPGGQVVPLTSAEDERCYPQSQYPALAHQRCVTMDRKAEFQNNQTNTWHYPYFANHQNDIVRYGGCTPTISNYSQYNGPPVDNNRHSPRYSSTNNAKPPYSYAALICMAIGSQSEKKATMREIINFIESNFSYYRANKKWHGTIRHDLTVNDCFIKLPARPKQKGCLWTIAPGYQDMFDNGSLRRRRYRFKEGSAKWLKSRAENAVKIRRKAANRPEKVDCPASPQKQKNNTCSGFRPNPALTPISQQSLPVMGILHGGLQITLPEALIQGKYLECLQPHHTAASYSQCMPPTQCKIGNSSMTYPGVKDSLLETDIQAFPNSLSPFTVSSGYNSAASSPEYAAY